MPKENNKMQVDIDTLKKQNVNDLLSIKELYKRIEELGEKTSQFKYIDNTLVKKLKKEYEKLKKIILDENVQAKLTNDVETINTKQVKLTNDIKTIKSQQLKLNNDNETINVKLDNKANKNQVIIKGQGTLNDFNEETRAVLQGLDIGQINAVLGLGNVTPYNLSNEILDVLKTCSNTPQNLNKNLSDIFDIGDGTYNFSISNTSITLKCISKSKTYVPLLFKKINGTDVKKIKTTVTNSDNYWIILGGEINNFTVMLVNNSTGMKGIYNITNMTTGTNVLPNAFSGSINSIELEITDSELKLLVNGTTEKTIPLSSFPSESGILTRPRVGVCFQTTNVSQTYDIYQTLSGEGLIPYNGNIPSELLSLKNDRDNNKNEIENLKNDIDNNKNEIENLKNNESQTITKQILKDLYNPFIFTKIKLIGDSITAGVGGTGYSPTGKTIHGGYKQVLPSGVCWGNMLKSTIEEQYNKYHYVQLTNENITRENISYEQITFDNNTILGEKWRCENSGSGIISFRFYGDNFYIVHPKINSGGILDVYIDDTKVGTLDTYGASTSWNNETQFTCDSVGYHDVKIKESGLKNSNSKGRTIFLESIKIPKTAKVENFGISGIGTSEVLSIKTSLIEDDDNIVIIQLGTNDRFKTTCPEKSKYLLKELIKYCEELGKKVIQFCSLPASVSDEESRNWTIKDLDRIINDIALERKQDYLSQYKLFKKYCEEHEIIIDEILADGLHPNDRGYKLMYINACIFLGISI